MIGLHVGKITDTLIPVLLLDIVDFVALKLSTQYSETCYHNKRPAKEVISH
jgi:hypothetical protein